MRLLDLPVEIIREILYKLDPRSFYNILSTAKYFREHALSSTHLLTTQIDRVPGWPALPQLFASDPQQLLNTFCKNATQHLFHGAEWMTDVHVWQSDRNVNRKISGILSWHRPERWSNYCVPKTLYDSENTLALVEVNPKEDVVTLYTICDGRPQSEHCIRSDVIFPHLSKYKPDPALPLESTAYRILRVRPVKADGDEQYGRLKIAILYEPVASDDADWKLIYIGIDPDVGPMVERVFSIEPRGLQFIDMAINEHEYPIIAWCYHDKPTESTTLTMSIYDQDKDAQDLSTRSFNSMGIKIISREAMSRLWVEGDSVHLLPHSIPMPRYTASALEMDPHNNPVPRFTHLPWVNQLFPAPKLGRTIASWHHCKVRNLDLNQGKPTCVNTALQLVITRDVREHELVRTGGYLVKALVHEDDCVRFNRGYDFEELHHIVIAQLAGLPNLYKLSSLGLILAVSGRSHRIAIASWKTLLIYSLDPQAFLDIHHNLPLRRDPRNAHKRVRQADPIGDYAFIEECGWQYYQNAPLRDECVVLEPVKLECDVVIHQLEWKNEHELWGWSDHGLIRWGIGAESKGERGCVKLKEWVRADWSDEQKDSLPLHDFTYLNYLEKSKLERRRKK